MHKCRLGHRVGDAESHALGFGMQVQHIVVEVPCSTVVASETHKWSAQAKQVQVAKGELARSPGQGNSQETARDIHMALPIPWAEARRP